MAAAGAAAIPGQDGGLSRETGGGIAGCRDDERRDVTPNDLGMGSEDRTDFFSSSPFLPVAVAVNLPSMQRATDGAHAQLFAHGPVR